MTQEYKNFMLDYLAGNKTDTPMANVPQLQSVGTITNNYRDYLYNLYGTFQYGGIIQPNNSNKILMYCVLTQTDNNSNSYYQSVILLLDENYNILDHVDSYSSGTKFKWFRELQYDEETNRLYGIEDTRQYTTSDPVYRFVMLDNPIMNYELNGELSCNLRRAYSFPVAYNTMDLSSRRVLYKDPNSSNYLIIGTTPTQTYLSYLKLQINVGSSNTWEQYNYAFNGSVNNSFVMWNSEVPYAETYGSDFYIYKLQNGVVSEIGDFDPSSLGSSNKVLYDVIAYSQGHAYISTSNYNSSYTIATACIYKYDNGTLTEIYNDGGNSKYSLTINHIRLSYYNNIPFVARAVATAQNYYDIYIGMLTNDTLTEIQVAENVRYYSTYIQTNQISNKRVYNLYTMGIQNQNNVYVANVVYNVDNYNGASGISVLSGVPHSMRLYAEDAIVFARNLYNMRINANTITSILEVPNTYLNDTPITNEDLYSLNNNVLDQQTETINTNIYETLYINTNDTWNMINRNDPLEPLTNKVGATRIVNSTAQQLDYDNAKAGVFRVVTSGGYYDRYINPSDISYDDGVYTYSFNFYGNPSITQIQILSYDKETIYCTYDISTESGKTYTYTQELTIE